MLMTAEELSMDTSKHLECEPTTMRNVFPWNGQCVDGTTSYFKDAAVL